MSDAASSLAAEAEAADAGDVDWAESEDDGGDDEATLDADEQAAAAEGVNIKAGPGASCSIVSSVTLLYLPTAPCRQHCCTVIAHNKWRYMQEEHAAETNALADEAEMPLDQLLAAYGFRIGPNGTKQRIDEKSDLAAQTARFRDPRLDAHTTEQLSRDAKQEQRHSPRTRQQPKPEQGEEAVQAAIKPEPAEEDFRHSATPAPTSPAGAQLEKVTVTYPSLDHEPHGNAHRSWPYA